MSAANRYTISGRAARSAFACIPLLIATACADTPSKTAPPVATAPPPPAASTEVFAYPTQGQDEQLLDRDRYECHLWAVRQSQFDPSLPGLPPHQRLRVITAGPPPGASVAAGAITGAALGAAVAGPYETGEGALVGAAAGAVLGAIVEDAQAREASRLEQAEAEDQAAAVAEQEQRAGGYRRAITACLEGRGYSVR